MSIYEGLPFYFKERVSEKNNTDLSTESIYLSL